ncbi:MULTISPECIES: DUF411 domain-containing protein [unclassified Rhizobium]|uniref:DUF411 domain-containing protein n=1 Tax=unclassified Rhizobium TaxID=2613769 RepID=UPI0021691E16|nr:MULTISPECIES: DUF411 domain-containing protein [unclassified Rhizobium]MCS3743907.1 hypothetical protein [Rhizobium sp. BK661]MCS4096002.1 hypothetical protein [Rhizobium sp. BK176]
MKRRAFMCLAAAGTIATLTRRASASRARMDIYKDPSCGCCGAWALAMVNADFNVVVREDDFMSIKGRLGIPEDMQGCHTAVVGDYFFEGHVPLEAVEKVLNEKPPIAGLAVPGMPVGSLGMGDDHQASYEVYSLTKPDMKPSLYMRMGG